MFRAFPYEPKPNGSCAFIASDHVVQFHSSDYSAASAIASFIAQSWESGDQFIIVARERRWQLALGYLSLQKNGARSAGASERTVFRDAGQALATFMRGGRPDAKLFKRAFEPLVEQLATRGRVRIFGEMVDVLAEQGNFAAAHALEQLWNQLGEAHHFTLLCGYSPERFSTESGRDALQAVCTAHARILPS